MRRADFDGADAAFEIEFGGEGYAGKLVGRNVGEKGAGVEIDGVASGRLDDGHSLGGDVIAEIGGGGDAVAKIVFVEGFLQADGDGFEIASGKAAIGGIALGKNEQIFFLLGEHVVVGAEKAADIGHAVFLGGHGAAVAEGRTSPARSAWEFFLIAGFAQLDEVGILGKAAGVEVKRNVVLAAERR